MLSVLGLVCLLSQHVIIEGREVEKARVKGGLGLVGGEGQGAKEWKETEKHVSIGNQDTRGKVRERRSWEKSQELRRQTSRLFQWKETWPRNFTRIHC